MDNGDQINVHVIICLFIPITSNVFYRQPFAVHSRPGIKTARMNSPTRRPAARETTPFDCSEDEFVDESYDVSAELRKVCEQTGDSFESTNRPWPDTTAQSADLSSRIIRIAAKESQQSAWTWTPIIIIFVMVIGVFLSVSSSSETKRSASDSTRRNCSFDTLRSKFPQQVPYLWHSLRTGIENVLNDRPTRPSVFFFAHNDSALAAQLLTEIVDQTEKCMQNNEGPLRLSSADFNNAEMERDYGVAIDKYHKPLESSGILLVTDANKISANVAQAFHTICDVHSPFVERAVIFLTMQLDDDLNNDKVASAPILVRVEEQLKRNWSNLNMNILQPLIARVTDQVLLLVSNS